MTPQEVWRQALFKTPAILRRSGPGQSPRARLRYAEDNRQWLQNGRRTQVLWNTSGKYWEFPKAWFNDFVDRALVRYGSVYVIQPYREKEVCAPACLNALGHICECSCLGANHGAGNDGSWWEVSETFAFRWQAMTLACRLLVARQGREA